MSNHDSLKKAIKYANIKIINLIRNGKFSSVEELRKQVTNAVNITMINFEQESYKELDNVFKEVNTSKENEYKDYIKKSKNNAKYSGYKASALLNENKIELRANLRGVASNIANEINQTLKDLSKSDENTVRNAKRLLINKFEKEGAFTITYANGAKVNAEGYATMVARTAKSEAINLKNIETCKLIGTDIVEFVSHHPNPCSVCATYNGRRYSISGKSKDYPSLYEKLLPNGYYVVHPNCRCELRPVILEYEDVETTKKKMEYSNSELKDPRTDKQKALYDKWQADNRRNAREVREYSEMKLTYGDKIPYKNIGSFRRASRSNTIPPNIKKFQYIKRDTAQYERWKDVVGSKNMPKHIDSFQELKYNDIGRFEEIRDYKNSINKGKLSPLVDYELYSKTKKEIDTKIIGIKAVNNVVIKTQSKHFIERVLGSVEQRRNGVEIKDIANCLKNGTVKEVKVDEKGNQSQKIELENVCSVAINIEYGIIIQTNPFKRRKK